MIIVHPNDLTTNFLKLLYPPDKTFPDITEKTGPKEVNRILNKSREIMILGHGNREGLFGGDKLLIGKRHGYYLRHTGRIIGIWCNAIDYARAQGLHGLFSGMVISELEEARIEGIETTQEELDEENINYALRLSELLWDPDVMLSDIPRLFRGKDKSQTPLTKFNYSNLWYI